MVIFMSDYIIGPIIDYILGILCSILAATVFTLAAVFQKKGDEQIKEKGVEIKMSNLNSLITMAKNKYWMLGMFFGIIGFLPYAASQILVGVTLSQPFQSFGLLVLILTAIYYLKEKLRIEELVGIGVIIVGIIFLALSIVQDIQPTIIDYTGFRFIGTIMAFYILCIVGIVVTWIFFKRGFNVSICLGLNTGFFFGMGAISSQIGMFFFELNLGLISDIGLVLGILMIFVGNMVATLIVQIAYQKGQVSHVIPVQSTLNYLLPVLGGTIIFLQKITYLFNFIFGISLIIVGGFLISRIQAKMQEVPDEDNEKYSNRMSTN